MFYLVKLKVTFRNTIFWCWIWPLIHTNHFYNLELIEIKAYSAPICISITIQQFGAFFSKNVNNLQFWTKLLRRNRKSLFHWKNPCLPKSMLFPTFWTFGNKTCADWTFLDFVCKVSWEKGKIFQWIILIISFYWGHINDFDFLDFNVRCMLK